MNRKVTPTNNVGAGRRGFLGYSNGPILSSSNSNSRQAQIVNINRKGFFYKKIGFIREGLKKINYGKFHTRGGVSEGHFPYPIFFIFFAPNGLKIIFRH